MDFWISGRHKQTQSHILLPAANNGNGMIICGSSGKNMEFGDSTFRVIDKKLWEHSKNSRTKETWYLYHLPVGTLVTCKKCLKWLNKQF